MVIDEEIKRIKDMLFETHLENTNDMEYIEKIMCLEDVTPEVRSVLVNMHTKYVTDLQGMKKHQYRVMVELTDVHWGIFNHITTVQNTNKELLNELSKKPTPPTKTTTTKSILPWGLKWTHIKEIGYVVVITILAIFLMFKLDAEAAKNTTEFVKEIIGGIDSGGKK